MPAEGRPWPSDDDDDDEYDPDHNDTDRRILTWKITTGSLAASSAGELGAASLSSPRVDHNHHTIITISSSPYQHHYINITISASQYQHHRIIITIASSPYHHHYYITPPYYHGCNAATLSPTVITSIIILKKLSFDFFPNHSTAFWRCAKPGYAGVYTNVAHYRSKGIFEQNSKHIIFRCSWLLVSDT